MTETRRRKHRTDSIREQISIRNRKKFSISELELLAVVWGLEKLQFYLYRQKVHLCTDHQALEPLIKRNRFIRQYSARLTRWLDRLTHFDISIQHIAESNSKFADCCSRNPVRGATPEEDYGEEYVINILTEQAELNLKYGPLFADQPQRTESKTKLRNNQTETQNEQEKNQSQTNRIFENAYNVNKTEQSETTTTGQSNNILALQFPVANQQSKIIEYMDQKSFYHFLRGSNP